METEEEREKAEELEALRKIEEIQKKRKEREAQRYVEEALKKQEESRIAEEERLRTEQKRLLEEKRATEVLENIDLEKKEREAIISEKIRKLEEARRLKLLAMTVEEREKFLLDEQKKLRLVSMSREERRSFLEKQESTLQEQALQAISEKVRRDIEKEAGIAGDIIVEEELSEEEEPTGFPLGNLDDESKRELLDTDIMDDVSDTTGLTNDSFDRYSFLATEVGLEIDAFTRLVIHYYNTLIDAWTFTFYPLQGTLTSNWMTSFDSIIDNWVLTFERLFRLSDIPGEINPLVPLEDVKSQPNPRMNENDGILSNLRRTLENHKGIFNTYANLVSEMKQIIENIRESLDNQRTIVDQQKDYIEMLQSNPVEGLNVLDYTQQLNNEINQMNEIAANLNLQITKYGQLKTSMFDEIKEALFSEKNPSFFTIFSEINSIEYKDASTDNVFLIATFKIMNKWVSLETFLVVNLFKIVEDATQWKPTKEYLVESRLILDLGRVLDEEAAVYNNYERRKFRQRMEDELRNHPKLIEAITAKYLPEAVEVKIAGTAGLYGGEQQLGLVSIRKSQYLEGFETNSLLLGRSSIIRSHEKEPEGEEQEKEVQLGVFIRKDKSLSASETLGLYRGKVYPFSFSRPSNLDEWIYIAEYDYESNLGTHTIWVDGRIPNGTSKEDVIGYWASMMTHMWKYPGDYNNMRKELYPFFSNVKTQIDGMVIAQREILGGEELFLDYEEDYWHNNPIKPIWHLERKIDVEMEVEINDVKHRKIVKQTVRLNPDLIPELFLPVIARYIDISTIGSGQEIAAEIIRRADEWGQLNSETPLSTSTENKTRGPKITMDTIQFNLIDLQKIGIGEINDVLDSVKVYKDASYNEGPQSVANLITDVKDFSLNPLAISLRYKHLALALVTAESDDITLEQHLNISARLDRDLAKNKQLRAERTEKDLKKFKLTHDNLHGIENYTATMMYDILDAEAEEAEKKQNDIDRQVYNSIVALRKQEAKEELTLNKSIVEQDFLLRKEEREAEKKKEVEAAKERRRENLERLELEKKERKAQEEKLREERQRLKLQTKEEKEAEKKAREEAREEEKKAKEEEKKAKKEEKKAEKEKKKAKKEEEKKAKARKKMEEDAAKKSEQTNAIISDKGETVRTNMAQTEKTNNQLKGQTVFKKRRITPENINGPQDIAVTDMPEYKLRWEYIVMYLNKYRILYLSYNSFPYNLKNHFIEADAALATYDRPWHFEVNGAVIELCGGDYSQYNIDYQRTKAETGKIYTAANYLELKDKSNYKKIVQHDKELISSGAMSLILIVSVLFLDTEYLKSKLKNIPSATEAYYKLVSKSLLEELHGLAKFINDDIRINLFLNRDAQATLLKYMVSFDELMAIAWSKSGTRLDTTTNEQVPFITEEEIDIYATLLESVRSVTLENRGMLAKKKIEPRGILIDLSADEINQSLSQISLSQTPPEGEFTNPIPISPSEAEQMGIPPGFNVSTPLKKKKIPQSPALSPINPEQKIEYMGEKIDVSGIALGSFRKEPLQKKLTHFVSNKDLEEEAKMMEDSVPDDAIYKLADTDLKLMPTIPTIAAKSTNGSVIRSSDKTVPAIVKETNVNRGIRTTLKPQTKEEFYSLYNQSIPPTEKDKIAIDELPERLLQEGINNIMSLEPIQGVMKMLTEMKSVCGLGKDSFLVDFGLGNGTISLLAMDSGIKNVTAMEWDSLRIENYGTNIQTALISKGFVVDCAYEFFDLKDNDEFSFEGKTHLIINPKYFHYDGKDDIFWQNVASKFNSATTMKNICSIIPLGILTSVWGFHVYEIRLAGAQGRKRELYYSPYLGAVKGNKAKWKTYYIYQKIGAEIIGNPNQVIPATRKRTPTIIRRTFEPVPFPEIPPESETPINPARTGKRSYEELEKLLQTGGSEPEITEEEKGSSITYTKKKKQKPTEEYEEEEAKMEEGEDVQPTEFKEQRESSQETESLGEEIPINPDVMETANGKKMRYVQSLFRKLKGEPKSVIQAKDDMAKLQDKQEKLQKRFNTLNANPEERKKVAQEMDANADEIHRQGYIVVLAIYNDALVDKDYEKKIDKLNETLKEIKKINVNQIGTLTIGEKNWNEVELYDSITSGTNDALEFMKVIVILDKLLDVRMIQDKPKRLERIKILERKLDAVGTKEARIMFEEPTTAGVNITSVGVVWLKTNAISALKGLTNLSQVVEYIRTDIERIKKTEGTLVSVSKATHKPTSHASSLHVHYHDELLSIAKEIIHQIFTKNNLDSTDNAFIKKNVLAVGFIKELIAEKLPIILNYVSRDTIEKKDAMMIIKTRARNENAFVQWLQSPDDTFKGDKMKMMEFIVYCDYIKSVLDYEA